MEKMCRLWLCAIIRLSRGDMRSLLEKFGSAEAVYNLSEDEINNISFLNDDAKKHMCLKDIELAENYFDYISKNNTVFLTPDDEDFPKQLFEIDDCPQGLFCRGKFIDMNNNILIGVVGARKCSQYGYECAKTIARDAAREGAIIVSGMALGVDSAAHEGALAANMPTIAVLGCGVNVTYPSSNRVLMNRIMETGMVMSEYPVNTKTSRYTFPERNRIISGISHSLLIAEAGFRSGSLITANLAVKQKKKLFAVPGNINSEFSKGTNDLIQKGAYLTTCAKDITKNYEEELSIMKKTYKKNNADNEYSYISKDNTDMEKSVLSVLTSVPQTVDDISAKTGLSPQDISTAMLLLELSEDVISHPGGKYSLPIK